MPPDLFLFVLDFAAWNDRGDGRHGPIRRVVFGFGRILLGLLRHFFAALVTFCHMPSNDGRRYGA